MTAECAENRALAVRLERIAELLDAQAANPFRVNAYRRAAGTVRSCPEPIVDLFAREGIEGLERLPAIGKSIASLLREHARSGRISLLARLAGDVSAEEVLATVPGVGPTLAHRVHEALGAETLEDLECASHDGRLAALAGFGPRRVAGIAAAVGVMLGDASRQRARAQGRPPRPSAQTYLAVDAEYRSRASAGTLARIAPRRFNPERRAWLPILHTERDGWHMTALYSNSARAHRFSRTDDWVVIYADRDGQHDQCTVVSERHGASWVRVIRGRELDCAELERSASEPGKRLEAR
jgi:hypothetical protein